MFYRVVRRIRSSLMLSLTLLQLATAPVGAAPDPEAELVLLAQDLSLEIVETGPDHLWTLHLSNLGETPVGVVADPGLLWFEVAVPGRAAPQICRLPEPLWPKATRGRAHIVLAAGERFSRRFDPRFFCFADLEQTLLVPGARVTPHFGWPLEATAPRDKRATRGRPPALTPPFAAWSLEAVSPPEVAPEATEEAGEQSGSAEDARAADARVAEPEIGLKQVTGATLALSPAYARWSQAPPYDSKQELRLLMLAGSDAEDEKNVTVNVGVFNAAGRAQQLYVRRDLLEYEVRGPDGAFQCPPGDLGVPDAASFSTIAPRSTVSFVVRLIEMCPRGGFARPGLYEVSARLDAKWSGQDSGLDAFTGTLATERPALIRVRSGDRSSFLRPALMALPAGGGPAEGGAPAAPAADGAPDGPAPEEAPPDHDGAGAPQEAPAPEAPADATSVE
jgi:hypothetical protein